MWTGYTLDLTIPSCAADNRQFANWRDHLEARWGVPDEQLREQHRRALEHLAAVQQPLTREVYAAEFAALRDELDRVLERADGRLEDLARDWWEASQPQEGATWGLPMRGGGSDIRVHEGRQVAVQLPERLDLRLCQTR